MTVVGEFALHLQDRQGNVHSFLPGQKVPGWVIALVTNPHALADDPEDTGNGSGHDAADPGQSQPPDPDVAQPPETTAAGSEGAELSAPTEGAGTGEATGQAPAPTVAVEPPPQAGTGSGRDAWAQYAIAKGVAVLEEWRRDQIIDACRQAGVAV
ncbi:phage-like protein [Mycobacteroides abscessus subsp. bolletii]|uniref:hypothetical protein n=1 Tax=Mycobacteroides abscessus TaxID=36809 RepID=UPI000925879F|nr:hypothetical protein [Mycobacteroides abscessus]SHX31745.1 phage-like protein [Mycobacteroides abscessus subsp. bolletii]SKP58050.1 phage-like protein [Mycobacteroides abscessus subsp. bolletii]SKP80982.1 phage-like protein [Mycobacteroides abscessus subsp. bolletii]SKQ36798.1 phage-like protein [Mycobacteroides abscessus subsp. bolletii]